MNAEPVEGHQVTSPHRPDALAGVGGRDHVVLLCAPSLGILDNWLPALTSLRERRPSVRITVLVPRYRATLQVFPDDTVISLVDDVVDQVVFPGPTALTWQVAPALASLGGAQVNGIATRVVQRIERRPPPGRVGASYAVRRRVAGIVEALATSRWSRRWSRRRDRRHPTIHLPDLVERTAVLCLDVCKSKSPDNQPVVAQFDGVPQRSLHHGIDLVVPSGPPGPRRPKNEPLRVYAFSDTDHDGYVHNFGIDPSKLETVGIPRHDPQWRERVIGRSSSMHPLDWNDVVFVISRKSNNRFLPAGRRMQALVDLRRAAIEERGLRVVVKLHPNEAHDGAFERAFGASAHGRTWRYSRAHPMHIASRSMVAMVFQSEVSVDMVACGVPVIERLDLRGIPRFDHAASVRDDRGRPILQYRQAGLVLAAHDLDELRAHLDDALADRARAVAGLRASYDEVFAPPQHAFRRIPEDLDALLEEQNRT